MALIWLQDVCHSNTPLTTPGDENGGVRPAPLLNVAQGGLLQLLVFIKLSENCPPETSIVKSCAIEPGYWSESWPVMLKLTKVPA